VNRIDGQHAQASAAHPGSAAPEDADEIVHFYSDPRRDGMSLLEIWEHGEADADSITPATYCPAYRAWIGAYLDDLLEGTTGRLVSLGCGNGFVERDLIARGYDVLGVDVAPEAVELARKKGVPAVVADVRCWDPATTPNVVYADGLFGHLAGEELDPVVARIASWLAPVNGTVVISNDAPRDGYVQRAPGVVHFHWLSEQYLVDTLERGGFGVEETRTFEYLRPISGTRTRIIVAATAGAEGGGSPPTWP
jgi:SAM-dependent methyltransferase